MRNLLDKTLERFMPQLVNVGPEESGMTTSSFFADPVLSAFSRQLSVRNL